MTEILILLSQLGKMAIYMVIGFILCRCNIISQRESRSISQLLLYAVIPCVILRSYLGIQRERLPEVFISLALGAAVLIIAILLSRLLFSKHPEEQFAAAFSNAGFMGIPLISGTLGPEHVMCISGLVALLNMLQWTYGQRLLARERVAFHWRQLVLNPLVAAYLLSFALFLLQIQLPVLLSGALDAVAECNAPLAMIVLGISLGSTKLNMLFSEPRAWLVSAVRLLLIPAVTVVALIPIPAGYQTMKMAILIAASAPVGANLVIYAQKSGADALYGARLVSLSTLLSLVSIPIAMGLAELLW